MNVAEMGAAMRARDAGMKSASDHAEADAPGWGERAYQAVAKLDIVDNFTIDYLRMWLTAGGLDEPSELRAWGSVTQKLIRDGVIVRVGYMASISSRGSAKPLYRLVRAG